MLNKYIPNFILYWDDFLIAIKETAQMMFFAGTISLFIGAIFGIIIVVTQEGGIMSNKFLRRFFDFITNLIWSIPFLILYMAVSPLINILLREKAISVAGAITPLIIGSIPFFARQVVSALSEVPHGLIEAAQSMGLSNYQIITKVYLKESLPSLARGASITLVVLFGLTTIAGSFGTGGLGIFVKRYGYDQNMNDILYVCLLVIVVLVFAIQGLGNYIAKKTTH